MTFNFTAATTPTVETAAFDVEFEVIETQDQPEADKAQEIFEGILDVATAAYAVASNAKAEAKVVVKKGFEVAETFLASDEATQEATIEKVKEAASLAKQMAKESAKAALSSGFGLFNLLG